MARTPKPRAEKRIRVRSKRLDQIDETKLALAVWLIAKGLVEDRTNDDADTSMDAAEPESDGSSP